MDRQTLIITNWSGIPGVNGNIGVKGPLATGGGGTDRIFFGNEIDGMTIGQLNQIRFVNPAGMKPVTYGAIIPASGEIVPVPEAASILAGLGLLLLAAWGGTPPPSRPPPPMVPIRSLFLTNNQSGSPFTFLFLPVPSSFSWQMLYGNYGPRHWPLPCSAGRKRAAFGRLFFSP
jgi:hypothetical protein